VDFRPPADTEVAKQSVALALRFDVSRLVQVEQVHGDRVIFAGKEELFGEKADALVATEPGTAVGVRIADCVPILLADPASGRVAAVHAGWRGVVAGIVGKTIALARERSIAFGLAAIGPCIGACCFEVGLDVAKTIAGVTHESVIERSTEDKAWVNLRRAVRLQLLRGGIAAIDDVQGCTRCDAEHFFSHRRDGDAAGRHLGVIVAR
jgi:hypothetical protein